MPVVYTGHTKAIWEICFSFGAFLFFPFSQPLHTTPVVANSSYHTHPEQADGTSFICASHDKLAILRNSRKEGDWQTTLEGHKGACWSAKIDRTGYLAATAGADCSARLWALRSSDGSPHSLTSQVGGNSFMHEFVHKAVVRTVEFSPVRPVHCWSVFCGWYCLSYVLPSRRLFPPTLHFPHTSG